MCPVHGGKLSSCLAGGGLLLGAVLSTDFTTSAVLYVAASLLYGLEFPVLIGAISRRLPRDLTTVAGLATIASYALFGLLTDLTGRIAADTGQIRYALLIFPFVFMAFGVLAWIWIALEPAHRHNDQNSYREKLA